MIVYKSKTEVEVLDRCNGIVLEILGELAEMVRPGISTGELDAHAEKATLRRGAKPAFKGYRGFPASLCASINEEVVHGIPSLKRVVKEGDLLSLDFGVILNGYFGDAAVTVPVGKVSEEASRLMNVTRESLRRGIEQMRTEGRLSDISHAIQTYVESQGLSVVRDFVGHGIGSQLHEDPQVPNYGDPGHGPVLRDGLILAIEPMVTTGKPDVVIEEDQWTARSADRSLSAHFERSVVVGENGGRILGGNQLL